MNQEKIGKLIAKLRKEKGLTQTELGNKVGVGFKAVSKWERGQTCPDISIINELSKILGITTDELLNGELNEENKVIHNKSNKFNKKILLLTIPIIAIISIIIIINQINNKQHYYNLYTESKDYYVEGKLTIEKDNISIYISKLNFTDKAFNKEKIKNYQYELFSGNNSIAKYGYIEIVELLDSEVSIKEFANNFSIDYRHAIEDNHKEITKKPLVLKLKFLDINDEIIEKNIEISLEKIRKK